MAKTQNSKENTTDATLADGSANAAPSKKKSGLVGAILTPLILATASFGTVYLLPSPETNIAVASVDNAEHNSVDPHDFISKDLSIAEMDEFIVSIKDNTLILRMSLALEVPKDAFDEVDPNELRLRDAFMGYLRAVDIASLQDPAFLPQLRAQLLRRSKLVLGQDKVAGVLITDFLIR